MLIRDRIVEFIRVPANELRPNPKNWRTHPKKQADALRGVLAEIGFAGAELTRRLPDGSLELIDGHLRAEVAGNASIPVLVLDVDESEADKLLATIDPLSAMATGDTQKLDALLREVQTSSEAVANMLTDLGMEHGCDWANPTNDVIEDEVPEPPTEPITKPGDLWILGEHRLLCGDTTSESDIVRLLDGNRVQCIFTDPPYGVAIGAKNRMLNQFQKSGRNLTDIVDDSLSPASLQEKLLPAFQNIRTLVMDETCTLFVCAPQGGDLGMMMLVMLKDAGLATRHVLIWKKNSPTFSMGRLDYDYQHEPILLTWGKKHKRPMLGKFRTSVWEIDKPRKAAEHPTMKPVELYANAYLNNSDRGDLVFDGYSGSGTAFIAAEQLGRRCFGMEISPNYCDVIIKRWESLTGRKAELDSKHGTTEDSTRDTEGNGRIQHKPKKGKQTFAASGS